MKHKKQIASPSSAKLGLTASHRGCQTRYKNNNLLKMGMEILIGQAKQYFFTGALTMLNIACKARYKKNARQDSQGNFYAGTIVQSFLTHDAFIGIPIWLFNTKPEQFSTANLLGYSPIFIFKNFSRAPPQHLL